MSLTHTLVAVLVALAVFGFASLFFPAQRRKLSRVLQRRALDILIYVAPDLGLACTVMSDVLDWPADPPRMPASFDRAIGA